MPSPSSTTPRPGRWSGLARGAGLAPEAPVLVALSGGADSVLLLHLIASHAPRPRIDAVHVDHGLRGAESDGDAAFCEKLCRSLGVPLRIVRAGLDPTGPGLEQRAREARYRALSAEARRLGHRVIVTAHHADDSLETLLQRWTRGDELEGLAGPRTTTRLPAGSNLNPTTSDLEVVRPLLSLRRGEIRRRLESEGLAWREDSSNADVAFTRNKIRHELLPALTEHLGGDALDHLRAFGAAVRDLEDTCARRTEHVTWEATPTATATRGPLEGPQPTRVRRGALATLPRALQRRALWRLLVEGCGRGPGRTLLELLLDDLARARCTRRHVGGGWTLVLRSSELVLVPPRPDVPGTESERLPFDEESAPPLRASLSVPGEIRLEDGRRLSARVVEREATEEVPRDPSVVELDARDLPPRLTVRFPRPGDRLRPLGAPGTRRLVRLLSDAGVPREERGRIPLVTRGEGSTDILWVAGVRPAHEVKVTPATTRRLELRLSPPDVEAASR